MKSYLESMFVRSGASRLISGYIQVGNGEGTGNPLQYCCLENTMDGGNWEAAVLWVAQSRTRLKQLSSSSRYFVHYTQSQQRGKVRAEIPLRNHDT